MLSVDRGDLVEERRGGVDALRSMVANLAAHHQSGAIRLLAPDDAGGHREAWLVVRLGQPVLAVTEDEGGLEALLAIEQRSLKHACDLHLYEMTVAQTRAAAVQHPGALLEAHNEHASDAGAWWSNTNLPLTGWRRTDSVDDLSGLSMTTDERPRTQYHSRTHERMLNPGGTYIHDSPDPHPLLQLSGDLAGHGVAFAGFFALPHAQTEVTRRLPAPTSFSLLRPMEGLTTLHDLDDIDEALQHFLWEHERSVVLLNGLDRLGNVFGDDAMVRWFRRLRDRIQWGDHVLLCTTDLGVFDAVTRRKLMLNAEPIERDDLVRWADDPDGLLDHPLLVPEDDEERLWMDEQLLRHAERVPHDDALNVLEGGSSEVHPEDRMEATRELQGVVASWPETETAATFVEHATVDTASIGATPWRPTLVEAPSSHTTLMDALSAELEAEEPAESAPRTRRPRAVFRAPSPPPGPRRPQRMKARKPSPNLPAIGRGTAKAIPTQPSPRAPSFSPISRRKASFNAANLDGINERMSRAKAPMYQRRGALHDAARLENQPNPPSSAIGPSHRAMPLPSATGTPAINTRRSVAPLPAVAVRESAQRGQHVDDLEALHLEWLARKERSQFRSTALYDEHGRPLERYGGGSA